jgi:protein TonB
MKRSDAISLTLTLVFHALLLYSFTYITAFEPPDEQIGFIQVDFGEFSDGRPVQRAPETRPEIVETQPDPEPDPEQQEPEAAPPEEAKPVDLPDELTPVPTEEEVEAPESEVESIAPEEQPEVSEAEESIPEPKPVVPLGSGDTEGHAGAAEGDEGAGEDEQKTAPFQIEGLNRTPVTTILPQYVEKINAKISIQVTVDPQGRVIRRIPLIKGNPALELAVLEALQRWRFNPLPSNAPQENQTGTITFNFRLQ